MKKDEAIKISGGLAVMLSVFLLLFVASGVKNNSESIKTMLLGNEKNLSPVNNSNIYNTSKVLSGTFSTSLLADVEKPAGSNAQTTALYRKISSTKLTSSSVTPVLKIEVEKNNNLAWIQYEYGWIDYQKGELYFAFASKTDGQTSLLDNFTGRYQLIIE